MGVHFEHDRGLSPDMTLGALSAHADGLAQWLQQRTTTGLVGHARGLSPDVPVSGRGV
jgi:hypothetical protein